MKEITLGTLFDGIGVSPMPPYFMESVLSGQVKFCRQPYRSQNGIFQK